MGFAVRVTVSAALLAACGGSGTDPAPPPSAPAPGGGDALFTAAPAGALPPSVLGGRSMEARAADLDGDGDIDILVAREFSPNVLLLNDGTGRFTDASAGRLPQTVRDSEDIALGDFDGDGHLDLVLVSEDETALTLGAPKHAYHLGDGRGVFRDVSERIAVRSITNAVAAGDLDGDGDLDLVFGNNGPETVLINDGSGRFADQSFRVPATADVTQDVLLGDVDGDGDLDLVVANESGGANRLLLNDGQGLFVLSDGAIPTRTAPEATRNADLGDVDGDGDLDLVFANVTFGGGAPQSRLLLNDGRGRFTDATAERLPVITTPAMDADLVDLDGDGDLDLVTVPFPAGLYRAYLNDGTGRFSEATARVFPSGLAGQSVEVEAADFDGNGRIDLYLANYVESPDLLLLAR